MQQLQERSFRDIWENTSYDLYTALTKIFRSIGWNCESYRRYSKQFGDVKVSAFVSDTNFEVSASTGQESVDLPPEAEAEVDRLKEFFQTIKTETGSNSLIKAKPFSRDRAKNLKKIAGYYKAGREAFSNIVPPEFLEEWRIYLEDDSKSSSSYEDDDYVDCFYESEITIGFELRSNPKNVYCYFGLGAKAVASSEYTYYPATMYRSNGDPGDPEEYDFGELEVQENEFSGEYLELCEIEGIQETDEVYAEIKAYAETYINNLGNDIDLNPEDYFSF